MHGRGPELESEAEIWAMCLSGRELPMVACSHQTLRAPRKNQSCQLLGFQALVTTARREYICVWLSQ